MWKMACLVALTVFALTGPRMWAPDRGAGAEEGFSAIEVYTVLDAGNDNTGSITRNNATTGSLGGTTGLERGIAVRPGDPTIVYIARGATSTGDGRPGGVIGLAAIKLQGKTDGDFNPNTDPDLPLTYIDTGLIVSGGQPANFSFMQGITYDPVLDKVWVLDGTGATPRVWYFDGGSLGGAPNGGGVSQAAVARGITLAFQADNASGLGGRGQALAVRVDPQDRDRILVALAMGNHVEVWESTSGLTGPWRLRWESATDPDGEGPIPAFGADSVRDVAFDERGDLWISQVHEGADNYLHRYSGDGLGRGRLPDETLTLLPPPFVLRPEAFARGFNALKFYREGETAFLIVANRSRDDARIAIVRYRREGEPGHYAFTALDGFGSNVSETLQDEMLRTLRLRGSARETQPGGGTLNGLMYLALPYAPEGDLTLQEEALYVNGFVVDGRKGQTLPTSGVIRVRLAPLRSASDAREASGRKKRVAAPARSHAADPLI
ncbi:hypothetical protein HRbin10_02656 [bacterium HR10]|nr:hypothetical protein HRbin10_02656 [bacterium HR10]